MLYEVPLDAFASVEQVAVVVKEQQHRGRCCCVVNIQDLQRRSQNVLLLVSTLKRFETLPGVQLAATGGGSSSNTGSNTGSSASP